MHGDHHTRRGMTLLGSFLAILRTVCMSYAREVPSIQVGSLRQLLLSCNRYIDSFSQSGHQESPSICFECFEYMSSHSSCILFQFLRVNFSGQEQEAHKEQEGKQKEGVSL